MRRAIATIAVGLLLGVPSTASAAHHHHAACRRRHHHHCVTHGRHVAPAPVVPAPSAAAQPASAPLASEPPVIEFTEEQPVTDAEVAELREHGEAPDEGPFLPCEPQYGCTVLE